MWLVVCLAAIDLRAFAIHSLVLSLALVCGSLCVSPVSFGVCLSFPFLPFPPPPWLGVLLFLLSPLGRRACWKRSSSATLGRATQATAKGATAPNPT